MSPALRRGWSFPTCCWWSRRLNVLDLFSGIGGFSLGLEAAGMRTVAFCEIEPYCRAILRRHWPDVPIHEDVRTLDGGQYRGAVELICGGYPCQPFSMAGRRRGEEDERHLWPQMYRLVREIRPRWVVAENVAGHISLGFDEVAASLEAEGFAVWPFIIPACAVGAPHRRDRVWVVANSKRQRLPRQGKYEQSGCATPHGQGQATWLEHGCVGEEWAVEPNMGRVAHGIPNRVERLRSLGNAVVPQIPYLIGKAVLQYEQEVS